MAENKVKIKINSLSKSFYISKGKVDVLNNVSFDVFENEFLVILGPGQCGKTVLLNIMADIESADSGEIKFDGKKDVGFVFQRYALFNWKNVLKNVEAPLKFKGVNKEERRKTARKYLDLVGLRF